MRKRNNVVMTDIKIKKCSFCVYLNKYDEEFIKSINNSIFIGTKHKDILEMFNDSKVLNDLQKPSKTMINIGLIILIIQIRKL